MLLSPIRLKNQIEDALSGHRSAAGIKRKIDLATKHMTEITKINGDPVTVTSIDHKDIYYTLKGKRTKYYYPIQYATIEIT